MASHYQPTGQLRVDGSNGGPGGEDGATLSANIPQTRLAVCHEETLENVGGPGASLISPLTSRGGLTRCADGGWGGGWLCRQRERQASMMLTVDTATCRCAGSLQKDGIPTAPVWSEYGEWPGGQVLYDHTSDALSSGPTGSCSACCCSRQIDGAGNCVP